MVCVVFLTLVLITISTWLIYVFLVWNFYYWKKRGVRGPKSTPFYGSFPNLIQQKRSVTYDMQDIYNEFRHDEDFVGVYSVRSPQLMVVSPKLAHDVFTKNFKYFHDNEIANWLDKKKNRLMTKNPLILRDEEWKERRQEVVGGITPSRVKAAYPVIQEVCGKLVNFIKRKCLDVDKNGVDAKDLSLRYTTEMVTDCVLGIQARSFSDNPTPILAMTKTLFQQTIIFTFYSILAGLWQTIRKFYQAKFFKKQTEDFFMNLMFSSFDIRRKQRVDRVDFLNHILKLQEKKKLSNEDLASLTMTILLDGLETSASAIMHCLYQLSKSPAAQEKLLAEILNNLDEKGELEFEVLNNLQYLDQCVYESIRIIPPLMFATKLCTQNCELTNKNGKTLQVKVDDVIVIPVYCFHHDERFYPNPNEFIPERFDAENGGTKKFQDMGVFYPFGEGPRICLGMKFALTQTKAAVATIVKNFNIKLNPKTRTDNLLDRTYFLGRLEGGVWLNFVERK